MQRVVACAGDQFCAALDAQHLGAAAGDGQGEVAQPAEQVGDAFARSRLQETQRAADQRAVHGDIDLGEVGRLERHHQAEFGQAVAEFGGNVGPEGTYGVGAFFLFPYLYAMMVGKRPHPGGIVVGPG